jgi:hypothetical protein
VESVSWSRCGLVKDRIKLSNLYAGSASSSRILLHLAVDGHA